MPKPKKTAWRLYSFNDPDLKQLADDLKNLVTRDFADFSKRGVSAQTLDDLQLLINNFDDFPTDEELEGEVIAANETKEALAQQVIKALRSVRSMAELAYNGTGKYHSFGFLRITKISDEALHRFTKGVIRMALKLQGDLAPQGLIMQMLDDLSALNTAFDNSIDDRNEAMEDRDIATVDRIAGGNKLYTEMVRLFSIGKSLYEDTDEARYNDYIISEPAPAKQNKEKRAA